MLEGDRMVGTPYDVSFRVDRDNESLCKKELNAKDLKKFRKAVKDDYYFQVSSLPALHGNERSRAGRLRFYPAAPAPPRGD